MKHIVTILLVCFIAVATANAQIVINRALFESARGQVMVQSTYELIEGDLPIDAVLNVLAEVGANKTFNFSMLTLPTHARFVTESRVNTVGESHPFADVQALSSANYVTRVKTSETPDTTIWSFVALSDNAYRSLGAGFVYDASGEKDLFLFEEFEFEEPLPQTYLSEWETVISSFSIPGIGSITVKNYNTVDSYGTLMLPGGRSGSALRIIEESETVTDIQIPGFAVPRHVTGYTYLTLDGMNLTVSVDEEGEPYAIDLSLPEGELTSIKNERSDLPEGFTLSQNYPNPFNPSTNIEFSIPFASDVTLTITDLTGRSVSTIKLPTMHAGSHTVTFNAVGLSSGIYMYRMEAGGYSTARKFTLIK